MRKEQGMYQDSLINIDEAVERLGGDESFLYELLNDFISEYRNYMDELQKEIGERNFDKIYVIGHTVKGASALLSLGNIREFSYQLEKAGKSRDIDKIKVIFDELQSEYDNLVEYYSCKVERIN